MINKPTKPKACKAESLQAYIRTHELEEAETIPEMIDIVHAHMIKTTPHKSECACDVCGGDSNVNLVCCPYCGDDAVEEVPTLSQDAQDQVEATETGTMKKTSKKKSKKATKKTSSKKATKKTSSKADKPSKPAKGEKSTAVVVATKSKELEKSLQQVRDLQRKGVECMHDLGVILLNLYENKLWTQMTKPDGTAMYDSWSKFCTNEIGFKPRYSYSLMDVALHFTKKDVIDVGVSKLNMLVRVPDEKRTELLKTAANTSKSELSKEVAKFAQGKPRETGRDGFKGKPALGSSSKKSTKLTIVRAEPRVVVELYKGSARAVEFDGATGTEECANGVKIHYTMMSDDKGRLSIAIETRRDG